MIFKKNQGYIATTSAVIIMALILIIAGIVSFSSYFNREGSLNAFIKERSLSLAEACADQALLKLAIDSGYAGDESVSLSEDEQCEIRPIESAGFSRIITVSSSFQNIISNIKVEASVHPLYVISWKEIVP